MEKTNYIKNGIKGLIAIFAYFFISLFASTPLSLIGIDISTLSSVAKIGYSAFIDVLLIIFLILLYKEQLKTMLKDMKKNNKIYFKKYFKYWFLILIIMYVSNLLIMILTPEDIANNEQSVRKMFAAAPILTYISAVFLAPFIEEVVFRLSFKNIFKNNIFFIIISGLVFGSLHVLSSFQSPYDLLYLIPYCTPGFVFAYIMVKTKNVFASMGMHFLHNGILMSLQILLLLLS